MNATPACAPHGEAGDWHGIDWAKAHRTVRTLQTRIVKAWKAGRYNKVKALQWLLTHSFSGKALAVKRVTENHGKNTPGVDGKPGRHRKPNQMTFRRSADAAITPNR